MEELWWILVAISELAEASTVVVRLDQSNSLESISILQSRMA